MSTLCKLLQLTYGMYNKHFSVSGFQRRYVQSLENLIYGSIHHTYLKVRWLVCVLLNLVLFLYSFYVVGTKLLSLNGFCSDCLRAVLAPVNVFCP